MGVNQCLGTIGADVKSFKPSKNALLRKKKSMQLIVKKILMIVIISRRYDNNSMINMPLVIFSLAFGKTYLSFHCHLMRLILHNTSVVINLILLCLYE